MNNLGASPEFPYIRSRLYIVKYLLYLPYFYSGKGLSPTLLKIQSRFDMNIETAKQY